MGIVYKRGKNWYIDVRSKGRRIRKRVGPSKRVAELALKDAEVKIARDQFGFSKNDITLDKLFDLFLDYSKVNHRPKSTERYGNVIDNFQRFLSSLKNLSFLSEVTTQLIDQYKGYRKSSNGNGVSNHVRGIEIKNGANGKAARAKTINFELDTLRMIFNLAIKWSYLTDNPVKGVTRLKEDDSGTPRFLTKAECKRFLDACPNYLYPVYLTFLSTGMRKAELEYLTWADVDFDRKVILVRAKESWNPKTGERQIPMNKELVKVLVSLKKSEGKVKGKDYVFEITHYSNSHNMLRNELIKIAQKAKIENLTKVHTLRHTFASHLVMSGVDLPTVSKLMGHSDIETTMIYAHLAPEHLADAVSKLSFLEP